MGDIEGGIALMKLARLYEKTNELDQAAAAYTQVQPNPLLLSASLSFSLTASLFFFSYSLFISLTASLFFSRSLHLFSSPPLIIFVTHFSITCIILTFLSKRV